jgi:hypothetical protein
MLPCVSDDGHGTGGQAVKPPSIFSIFHIPIHILDALAISD